MVHKTPAGISETPTYTTYQSERKPDDYTPPKTNPKYWIVDIQHGRVYESLTDACAAARNAGRERYLRQQIKRQRQAFGRPWRWLREDEYPLLIPCGPREYRLPDAEKKEAPKRPVGRPRKAVPSLNTLAKRIHGSGFTILQSSYKQFFIVPLDLARQNFYQLTEEVKKAAVWEGDIHALNQRTWEHSQGVNPLVAPLEPRTSPPAESPKLAAPLDLSLDPSTFPPAESLQRTPLDLDTLDPSTFPPAESLQHYIYRTTPRDDTPQPTRVPVRDDLGNLYKSIAAAARAVDRSPGAVWKAVYVGGRCAGRLFWVDGQERPAEPLPSGRNKYCDQWGGVE